MYRVALFQDRSVFQIYDISHAVTSQEGWQRCERRVGRGFGATERGTAWWLVRWVGPVVYLQIKYIYSYNIYIYIYTSGVYIHSHPPKNETIRPDWNCNNLLFWHLFWWLCLHYVLNLFMVCVVDWWVDSEVDRVDKQQTHMEILLDGHLSSRPFEREPRKWRWMSAPN